MALKLLSSVFKENGASLQQLKIILPYMLSQTNQGFHTTAVNAKVESWLDQNEWVYPPQKPGEPRRPAWVNHCRENIKYSPKKMWYVACLPRGLTVDEAIKQLSHVPMRGAVIAREVIEEAQEMAVKEHNVEFKSNLWVAESFVGRGVIVKGLRKHAKMRLGLVHYRYCHYFVRLVEGSPPEHYYRRELTGDEKLEKYFEELRSRTIQRTL